MIREVALGHLHFGLRPRLALRVVYAPDARGQRTVYLTAGGAGAPGQGHGGEGCCANW